MYPIVILSTGQVPYKLRYNAQFVKLIAYILRYFFNLYFIYKYIGLWQFIFTLNETCFYRSKVFFLIGPSCSYNDIFWKITTYFVLDDEFDTLKIILECEILIPCKNCFACLCLYQDLCLLKDNRMQTFYKKLKSAI